MICTGRSGPNWLDRLRSSKGFPVSNGVDLEHFLNPNLKNDTIVEKNDRISIDKSSEVEEKKKAVEMTKKTVAKDQKNSEKEDLFGIMSSVLSELFNMGNSGNAQQIREFDKKKGCRKQKNPKLCVFSESASVDDYVVPAMLASRVDNSVAEENKLGFGLELKKSVEGGENLKARFLGYSRADVTIIDTSAPVWKSEKLVFRKGNVWKVWERKSKCRKAIRGTKKRKSSQISGFESVVKKKKKKKKKMKKMKLETPIMLPNEGSPQNDATGAWRKPLTDLSQVPGKRLWFSRSPRKPAKKGSPVFHVQPTPSRRKNGDQQLPNFSPLGMH